jgi:hypothetical protein
MERTVPIILSRNWFNIGNYYIGRTGGSGSRIVSKTDTMNSTVELYTDCLNYTPSSWFFSKISNLSWK